jgi:hypothetical protein
MPNTKDSTDGTQHSYKRLLEQANLIYQLDESTRMRGIEKAIGLEQQYLIIQCRDLVQISCLLLGFLFLNAFVPVPYVVNSSVLCMIALFLIVLNRKLKKLQH